MGRFHGICTLIVVLSCVSCSPLLGQVARGGPPRLATPRQHERIAASILRRQRMNLASAVDESPGPRTSSVIDELPPPPPSTQGISTQGMTSQRVRTATAATSSVLLPEPPASSDVVVGSDVVVSESIDAPWLQEPTMIESPGGCDSNCGQCELCRPYCWIDTLHLWGGVHGMTGPFNRGGNGSFGFQEGFNWGSPWVFTPLGMNTQIGFQATQSNFNGADFTTDDRTQYFVTAGFFRRAHWGWQGGLVFDYLHEDWYTQLDLGQIRGEFSWAMPDGGSFGVWFATSVSEDTVRPNLAGAGDETWESHDLYTAFYRVRSNQFRMGQWRVFAGFTGASDGLIGSDFKIPMAGTWSLEPEFTYLIPDEGTGAGGNVEEAWNVAINLVWYPGRAVNGLDYDRLPMFNVANNGSMIAHRKR